ncbi:hypothetical protein J437_LFUL013033 [Ladona fulva]|uniref:Uncharacterized protein n=1 Tax=Ladona fulva TaxID=123851 RepID=A0A8K0P8T9_LADFU|nr:hypothetical protein J437_LFUL013033 [Ladona fulva]
MSFTMPYTDKYKKKGSRYEDERSLRAAVKERERREARRNDFVNRRNIEEDILKPLAENITDNIKGKINLRLLQWKQKKERERQEAMEKKKKKPPFVVGVVRHEMVPKFPSPVNLGKRNKSIKMMANSITMKLRQVMVEKSFAPICHEFKAPSSVIPILMVPSKSKQNHDHLSNKRLKKEPKQRNSKGKPNSNKIITSKQNEVKPRRSARLTSKTKEAPEGRNSPEIKNSVVPVLNSIEESGNQNVISEEEVKSDLLSHPLMFAASFSPFICRARGKDRHQSPAKKPETPIRSRVHNYGGRVRCKILTPILNIITKYPSLSLTFL